MAGDIGMRERALILGAGDTGAPRSRAAGAALPPEATGRVRHVYGQRVMIVEAPDDAAADSGAQRALDAAGAETVDASAVPAATLRLLSPAERLGLEAFALRESPAYADAKANRPRDGQAWDAEGEESAPACAEITAALQDSGSARGAEAGAPTSAQLTGRVAVGIIIIDGPTAALKFTAAERTQVVAEVQNGLGWLASQSPTGVTFVYDIKPVTISAQPGAASLTLAQKEALFRDPAMAQLGRPPGLANVTAYVEALRTQYATDWAYCVFFVKYPVGHFAYASIGGPRIVMHYDNDGWGPDNIDRVFAHETGHIFGAPDEYASSGCDCGGSWGVYGRPNGNCANCAAGGGVDCLMKANTWAMCALTPYHLGFPLVDQTYSGVWRQGTGAHYLWVNASWTSFQQKWTELAGQGLRLHNFKITRDGGAVRYHGVFRQGTGGHYLWVNASWASFHQKWTELSAQGLRLACLEVNDVGGTLVYSGAWLPGTAGHYLWVNADWPSFQAKWQELAAQNLRLTDLRIVRVGAQDRYFGVWKQATGGHYLWVGATWPNFQQKWQEVSAQGLRLVDLEISNTAGDRRYSGVFLPGTDGHYLWVGASWQNFRAKWEELSAQGLRLVDFDVVPATGPQSPTPDGGALADAARGGVVAGDGSLGVELPTRRRTGTGSTAFAGRRQSTSAPHARSGGTREDAGAGDGVGFGGGDVGGANGTLDGGLQDGGAGFGGGDLGAAGRAGNRGDGRGEGGGDPNPSGPPGEADGFGIGDLTLSPDESGVDAESEDGYGGGSLR
jgi:hypothetical protein